MHPIADDVRAEIVRIRLEERLGPAPIARRLGVSKTSVYEIVKHYPLSDRERAGRKAEGSAITAVRRTRYRPAPSRVALACAVVEPTRWSVHQIAVEAVERRLVALGVLSAQQRLEPGEPRPGDSGRPYVIPGTGLPVYVRTTVHRMRDGVLVGRPHCPFRDARSRIPFSPRDCVAVLGYDVQTDTVHVFAMQDVAGKNEGVIRPETAEAWHSIGLAREQVPPSAIRPAQLPSVITRHAVLG